MPSCSPANEILNVKGTRMVSRGDKVEIGNSGVRTSVDSPFVVAMEIKDKGADEASQQREALLRLLVSEVRDYAILILDPEGRIASWNAGAERIKGYAAEEIIGQHFSRFYPAEDVARGQPAYALKLAIERGRFEVEGWRVRKDGSRFWASVVIIALRDDTGRLHGFGKITRDITERKESEQTQARLLAILKAAPDFIGIADAKDAHILYVNPAGRKMTGLGEQEDVTKLQIADVHPKWTNQMLRDRILPATIRNGYWMGECAFLHRDGHEIPVLMAVHAHKTMSGEVELFSTISRDIAERKRREHELKQRTIELELANLELETFSYSVSHDLCAPLRNIEGFGQALLEDYAEKLDPDVRDYVERVRSATHRMRVLIDDLLNLARVTKTPMRRAKVDLSAMARSIAKKLQKDDAARSVTFVIQDGLVTDGDSQLLLVVMENLLSNAWKYTSTHDQARIEFGCSQQNGRQTYFVRDDGVGFDPRYADRLFRAFQRLHSTEEFPGTGVGLATVQRIIQRHGGQVWGEGKVENGATFYFVVERRLSSGSR